MADIKLFRVNKNTVDELKGTSVQVEKSLQEMIERNLETFLGIRFLKTEHSTGKSHRGRIDSLGIDENNCPVIIEYKRSINENVINQGLFYLDWLMDHKAEFKFLVMDKFDKKTAEDIEWSSPRLVCIAGDFTKFDEHAVKQMDRNIDLIRYRFYEDNKDRFVLLELVNSTFATSKDKEHITNGDSYVIQQLNKLDKPLKDVWESLEAFTLALGDDVNMRVVKGRISFRKLKVFIVVKFRTKLKKILVWVQVDPKSVKIEKGFLREMGKISSPAGLPLEITLKSKQDFEKAKDLIVKSYENS